MVKEVPTELANLLVDPKSSFEKGILEQLAQSCGATAASIIRIDRSGRNKRESDGLLFEQLAKWLSPNAKPIGKGWTRFGDEFYGRDQTWGVTGLALLSGRVVDVSNIKPYGPNGAWNGDSLTHDGSSRTPVTIKSTYCDVMEELIGSPLKDMLVCPVHTNNIVVGAVKLFNHDYCEKCGDGVKGFEGHLGEATKVAARLAEEWLNTHPIRCEVVTVFIDVTDSTSFLIANGYYDGARVFQVFTNAIQKEMSAVAEEIHNRPPDSRAALYGGLPFLDKFTGDGVLLIFPYDKIPLMEDEHIESKHIWPHVKRIIEAAHKAWQTILESVECRRVLREAALSTEPLKIAISSGSAYIGSFGGHLSAVGRPLIEASRILSNKDIYEASFGGQRGGPHIVASQQFVDDFELENVHKNAEKLEERWQLRGLPGNRVVYKLLGQS